MALWSVYRDGATSHFVIFKNDDEWRYGYKKVASFEAKQEAILHKKLFRLDAEIPEVEQCLQEPSSLAPVEIDQFEIDLRKLKKAYKRQYEKCCAFREKGGETK